MGEGIVRLLDFLGAEDALIHRGLKNRIIFGFLVCLFGVDRPKVGLVRSALQDIVHRHHGGEHGMVLIVIFMHAVSTDGKQVLETVQEFDQFGKRS